MSHENVVATADYVLSRDANLKGGDLLFKRAFLNGEAATIGDEVPQWRTDRFNEIVEQGLIPLGRADTRLNRLVVFPNSHVHRVEKM
jgi:hypothetical protein